MQRSALCRSRRELSNESLFSHLSFQIDPNSNEYLVAIIGFDTAENEPCKVCPLSLGADGWSRGRRSCGAPPDRRGRAPECSRELGKIVAPKQTQRITRWNNCMAYFWKQIFPTSFCGISAGFWELVRTWWPWHQYYQYPWNSAKKIMISTWRDFKRLPIPPMEVGKVCLVWWKCLSFLCVLFIVFVFWKWCKHFEKCQEYLEWYEGKECKIQKREGRKSIRELPNRINRNIGWVLNNIIMINVDVNKIRREFINKIDDSFIVDVCERFSKIK